MEFVPGVDLQTWLAELPINQFTLKLTDFGIARHINQSESMEMTKAGSVMGTPKYMSPEQHDSSKVWEKTVQWDLESDAKVLWPLVSNTERLNEALGFPAVDYRTENDPIQGVKKFGSSRETCSAA